MRRTKADAHLLDTRFPGDEFVVVADVLGTSEDDLFVGLDPDAGELVIKAEESLLERITLPWKAVEATSVRLNNGILDVRIQSAPP